MHNNLYHILQHILGKSGSEPCYWLRETYLLTILSKGYIFHNVSQTVVSDNVSQTVVSDNVSQTVISDNVSQYVVSSKEYLLCSPHTFSRLFALGRRGIRH